MESDLSLEETPLPLAEPSPSVANDNGVSRFVIYGLLNERGVLVYIGQTQDLKARAAGHRWNWRRWRNTEITAIELDHAETRAAALQLERDYIIDLRRAGVALVNFYPTAALVDELEYQRARVRK